MKILRRIIVLSAVFSTLVLASVLSGCANSAQSQPLAANSAAAPWRAKFGQKCSVLFSTKVGGSLSVDGVLKSATDEWIVMSDVDGADNVNGKIIRTSVEYHIPIANIIYLSFSQPRKTD